MTTDHNSSSNVLLGLVKSISHPTIESICGRSQPCRFGSSQAIGTLVASYSISGYEKLFQTKHESELRHINTSIDDCRREVSQNVQFMVRANGTD